MGDPGFPGQLGMRGEKGLPGPAGGRVSSQSSAVISFTFLEYITSIVLFFAS